MIDGQVYIYRMHGTVMRPLATAAAQLHHQFRPEYQVSGEAWDLSVCQSACMVINGRQTHADARAAVEAGTATEEQRGLVKAQAEGLAEGRQTMADARAAVEAGTATEEQRGLVKAQAEGLPDWQLAPRQEKPRL